MTSELNDKLETILHSAINRLYNKEATLGLDLEDLKALEILYKISKDTGTTSKSAINSPLDIPYNIIDLLRAAKGSPDDSSK